MNLIGNATKFTDSGEIVIAIAPNPFTTRLGNILFTVQDTGIGISPEQMPNLFLRFGQGDTSISRRYGGTGLGLSITKSLVERMGGTVWAESKPLSGTTISFTLNLPSPEAETSRLDNHEARNAALITPPPDQGVKPKACNPAPNKNYPNVLVVDDHEANRLLMAKILERYRCQATFAHNGLEALHLVHSKYFDLILMDIQMPIMDGYTTTREIRAWEQSNDKQATKIVAVTAHALAQDSDRSLEAGCDAHIIKPIKLAEVLSLLDSLCLSRISEV